MNANVKPESDLVKQFDIALRGGGLPMAILVSPEGEILAAGMRTYRVIAWDLCCNVTSAIV